MKKLLAFTTLAMLLSVAAAYAAEAKTALGFHTYSAPVGIRTWLSPKAGLDVGVGFTTASYKSDVAGSSSYSGSGFTLDVGVPYVLKSWDKVKFIGRPGLMIGSSSQDSGTPNTSQDKTSGWAISGELEVELMVADNVSISMSHGLAYSSESQTPSVPNGTSAVKYTTSGIDTFGAGWTSVGFHVYLW